MSNTRRLQITIYGAVQGVGFRPFIFRLASDMNINGWVCNTTTGVIIEAEGPEDSLNTFLIRIEDEKPPIAFIYGLETSLLPPTGYKSFQIRESQSLAKKNTVLLPDIATCSECLKEIFNPADRRYYYPFTNCTHCGPRFSIILSMPYDRVNTTMKKFEMCGSCREEYETTPDRRFHAQPNACPECGPRVELWSNNGVLAAGSHDALKSVCEIIRDGKIVALKGLGGFHLIVDAGNDKAVLRLRKRKFRPEKPFALMFPDMKSIHKECILSSCEEHLLSSHQSPIVLLKRKKNNNSAITVNAAPGNPYLGIMLPYTPLHHIIMKELSFPIVATSGNISDEPICTDEKEALQRLGRIADYFLVHNRPIARYVDDSIVHVMSNRVQLLRRARGYAPLPVYQESAAEESSTSILALGAHLKNTITLQTGKTFITSQHIGDLDTFQSFTAFKNVVNDFKNLYGVHSPVIVCDRHPEYISTEYGKKLSEDIVFIQHHYAHVAGCMAENEIDGEVLGVCWDGTGYGMDKTIWGGEFLLCTKKSFKRAGYFERFQLPGGEKSIKEPRRSAIGLLYKIFGEKTFSMYDVSPVDYFSDKERKILSRMLARCINSPWTSSVGRMFDAVASIAGVRQINSFEAQSAMELEFSINGVETDDFFHYYIRERKAENIYVVDWKPMVKEILVDITGKVPVSKISAKFHNTLVNIIVETAGKAGIKKVVLSGGCFQNRYLTERAVKKLEIAGYEPYYHQRVPTNDGGISYGQAVAAYSKLTG